MAVTLKSVAKPYGAITSLKGVQPTGQALGGVLFTLNSVAADAGAVQNTWYDIINVSGQGFIEALSVFSSSGTMTNNYQCRLEIDGVEVYLSNTDCWASGDTSQHGVHLLGISDTTSADASSPTLVKVPFYTNFKVQVRCTNGSVVDNFTVRTWYYLY